MKTRRLIIALFTFALLLIVLIIVILSKFYLVPH